MYLPNNLTDAASKSHNIAKTIPITEKLNIPPTNFCTRLREVEVGLPAGHIVFNLPKLDMRSKALFTRAFSEAEAGVVGIDSTKDHRAVVNHESVPPSSVQL